MDRRCKNDVIVRIEEIWAPIELEIPTPQRTGRVLILTGIVLQVGIGGEVFHRINNGLEAMMLGNELLVLVCFVEIACK